MVYAKFMHGHFHGLLPVCFASFFVESRYLHSYHTRHSALRNYNVTNFKTSKGQKSIQFLGPKIWNDIPHDMRILSKVPFKTKMKSLILSCYWFSHYSSIHLLQLNTHISIVMNIHFSHCSCVNSTSVTNFTFRSWFILFSLHHWFITYIFLP